MRFTKCAFCIILLRASQTSWQLPVSMRASNGLQSTQTYTNWEVCDQRAGPQNTAKCNFKSTDVASRPTDQAKKSPFDLEELGVGCGVISISVFAAESEIWFGAPTVRNSNAEKPQILWSPSFTWFVSVCFNMSQHVQPSFMLAPNSTKTRTTSEWPPAAARCLACRRAAEAQVQNNDMSVLCDRSIHPQR